MDMPVAVEAVGSAALIIYEKVHVSQSSTIRTATPNDLALLLCWGGALHEIERAFEPQLMYNEAVSHARYMQELRNRDALFLIAEHDEQAVGYLYAYVVDAPLHFATQTKHCIIEVVYLEPQARGRGIAQDLIARCSEWARAAGASRLTAGMYAANEPSIKLLTKHGFAPYHITMVCDLDNHK